jgi:hypothetical protein
MLIKIYCSGSIPKGSGDRLKLCWTDAEKEELAKALQPIAVRYLNPDDPLHDLSDTAALFGRDLYQVQLADFVVVDARERRGIGIGIEMLASRILGTPLVVVAPKNTHYRMDELHYRGSKVNNYIHPHMNILADTVVDSFALAGEWIKAYLDRPVEVKNSRVIFEAIETYKVNMLPKDQPMLEVYKELQKVGNGQHS